jgi:dihydropteroate synthase
MQVEIQNINSNNLKNKFENRPIAKILFRSKRKNSGQSNDSPFSIFKNYSNVIKDKFDEEFDSLNDISSFELENDENKRIF